MQCSIVDPALDPGRVGGWLGAEAAVDGVEPLAVIIGAGMLLAYGIGDVFIVERYG